MHSRGGYEILREIGRGSMGVVRVARQRDLERLVALKELKLVHANAPGLAERFVREARLAGSLSHPNIVTVFETFELEGTPYIAMEYMPRGSLRSWVGRLTPEQFAGVIDGLLAGLSAAGDAGIVHRDLKPENVMVASDGRVRIADFGIAKATENAGATQGTLTETGTVVGTPAYMAPEQALSREIGPWTDLYSLGIVAYELLVGRVPFADSRSSTEILMRHVNEPIGPVTEHRKDVSPALAEWISSLLVKDPEQRVKSASQAWDQLEEIVIGELGARWRRLALLDALPDEETDVASPPNEQKQAPEAESGFLSYQRGSGPWSLGASQRSQPSASVPAAPVAPLSDSRSAEAPGPVGVPERAGTQVLRRVQLAGLAVALAVGGYALVPSVREGASAREKLGSRVSSQFGELSLQHGWRRDTSVPNVTGLDLRNPLALVSANGGGTLVIGTGTSSDATLLPDSLLGLLSDRPAPEVVKLGGEYYYRYRRLATTAGPGAQALYAMPTTGGILTGVCLSAQRSHRSTESECEQMLGSLRLSSGHSLRPGPDAAYAERITTVMSKLKTVLASQEAGLRHASTPGSQALTAERLAASYRAAGVAVGRAAPGAMEGPPNRELASALNSLEAGYSRIALAARRQNRSGFGKARKALANGIAGLNVALARLARLGYRLGG